MADADPAMRLVPLTTEEEGIALLAGAWWGGQRGVLLMQSSGVGNCINMLSLPLTYRLPLVMLVTMRGDWGEFNPMQVPMGTACAPVLEAMGVLVRRADSAEAVAPAVEGAARLAFAACRPAAVLIGQQVIGAKNFAESRQ
jgi:sulfopyruvate decarboxylase alpha subunit